MLKPLTEEQLKNLTATATGIFAEKGFSAANINTIAHDAGLSVGVIYKYFRTKGELFEACVRECLKYLDQVFELTEGSGGSLTEMMEKLIAENQKAAKLHPEYFRLYHQITVAGDEEMVRLIEQNTSKVYTGMLRKAKETGEAGAEIDPASFAFFFDNLMMMLHFSYACGYYEDRFMMYMGDDVIDRDEYVREQLMTFLCGALGIER